MSSNSRSVVSPQLLRSINIRRVLEALAWHGPLSRAELSRRISISAPTMSQLVAALQRSGLIEREPKPLITGGRPAIVFRVSHTATVLGVVVDIATTTVVRATLDGQIDRAHRISFSTPPSFETLILRITDAAHQLVTPGRRSAKPRLLGIGLTVPGLINRQTGEVRFSPNLHFLDGRNPAEALAKQMRIHVRPLQEEHALCLAAQHNGPARDLMDFALLDVSAGLGMGIVSGGRFVEGAHGFAGEIGHICIRAGGRLCGCGHRGCLETIATDTALLKTYSERVGRTASMEELIAAVRAGDHCMEDAITEAADALGYAVSLVVNILDPQAVLLYGRMLDLDDHLIDRIRERVRGLAMGPSFECCQLLRTETDKVAGAVAGILEDVFAAAGPRLPASASMASRPYGL